MKLSDWSPSQSWLSGFILVLCLHILSVHYIEAGKPRLTVGVILPDHSFHNRGNKIKVNKEVKNLRGDENTVTKVYDLQPEVIFMDDYSPSEILDNMCNTIMEKHVNTVLYMSNADYLGEHTASGQYLLQVCNTLGIPVIAWNADNSGFFQPTAESIIMQMAPSIGHQCRVMLSLLRRYGWRAFSIITGSLAGEDHFVNNLRDLSDQSDINFEILSVIRIARPEERVIREAMKKLYLSESRVMLLYASKREAEIIFRIAKEEKVTGKGHIWIVTQSILGDLDKESSAPDEFPIGLLGIYFKTNKDALSTAIETGIQIWGSGLENLYKDLEENPRIGYNVSLSPDMDCDNVNNLHWQDGRELYNFLVNVNIEDEWGEHPPVRFNDDGTITDTQLEIVNLKMNRQWEPIGEWSMMSGIKIDDITWPGDDPTPPKGRPDKYHIKVVTIPEKPYIVHSDPDKSGQCPAQAALCRIAPENQTNGVTNATSNSNLYQCCSGLCIDLLKYLSDKIGFEYDLFQVEDRKFGAYDKDTGRWNGLVGALKDGKADMSLASLSITEERSQVIDFSVPFLETGITIIVAVREGVISPTAFLEPYDYPSWCLILVFSVHASGAAIFIFEWLSPSGLDRGDKPLREHRFSLFRSFWLIWAMLFGAAVNTDNPRGVSSRFMANIWALFAVVFTASYTANLAAFMITKEDYDKLTGIKDWRLMNPYAHKPPFRFATVPSGSTEANLRKNYPDMYNYMKPYNRTSVQDGVRAVKEQQINAFIYDATVLEYLASHDNHCKLRTVGNWYATTGYGLGFPRGSKWIKVVNKYLSQLQHNGDMERLQKFWLSGACTSKTEDGESSQPLGILNFTSAFILLAGGMLLGGLLLLLEHIYFKFFRRKLRKWDRCGCCGLVSLSMGKSLTFEQSVREAMDLQRNFKCKNPVCETQTWKVKHELDLALLRIDRLQRQLGEHGIPPVSGGIWKDPRDVLQGPPPAIGFRPEYLPAPEAGGEPHSSHNGLKGTPGKGGGGILGGPSSSPYPQGDHQIYPVPNKYETKASVLPYGTPENSRYQRHYSSAPNKKGSKSLPNSPVKRPLSSSWTRDPFDSGGRLHQPGNQSMKRAQSIPEADPSMIDRKTGDKKTKYHKGHMYQCVPDDPGRVEKETVL